MLHSAAFVNRLVLLLHAVRLYQEPGFYLRANSAAFEQTAHPFLRWKARLNADGSGAGETADAMADELSHGTFPDIDSLLEVRTRIGTTETFSDRAKSADPKPSI
jgi:hypothetical protein